MKLDYLSNRKKTNHASGLDAETLAQKHLEQNGFNTIETRFKCKHGEIDLIAEKDSLLIFVEVKQRKTFNEDDPISAKQKQRINNAALQYLSNNPEKNSFDMRFDSILIDSTQTLTHIEDSWRLE